MTPLAKLIFLQRKAKGLTYSPPKPSKSPTLSMNKAYDLVKKFRALEGFSDLADDMEKEIRSQDVVLVKKMYDNEGDLVGETKYFADGKEEHQKKYPMSDFAKESYEKLLQMEKKGLLSEEHQERLDFIREYCF